MDKLTLVFECGLGATMALFGRARNGLSLPRNAHEVIEQALTAENETAEYKAIVYEPLQYLGPDEVEVAFAAGTIGAMIGVELLPVLSAERIAADARAWVAEASPRDFASIREVLERAESYTEGADASAAC